MRFQVNTRELNKHIAKYALEREISINTAKEELFGTRATYHNNKSEMNDKLMIILKDKGLDIHAFLSVPE